MKIIYPMNVGMYTYMCIYIYICIIYIKHDSIGIPEEFAKGSWAYETGENKRRIIYKVAGSATKRFDRRVIQTSPCSFLTISTLVTGHPNFSKKKSTVRKCGTKTGSKSSRITIPGPTTFLGSMGSRMDFMDCDLSSSLSDSGEFFGDAFGETFLVWMTH